ncbi:hypothetical protein BOC48_09705 [Burkholderia pseudomallei]|nr:hypothetical protein BOC47_13935 [Burkholderia pseudomallei]ARL29647.1 hypothetical protein BOC48_09705 [Burkholderia pseudomallei]
MRILFRRFISERPETENTGSQRHAGRFARCRWRARECAAAGGWYMARELAAASARGPLCMAGRMRRAAFGHRVCGMPDEMAAASAFALFAMWYCGGWPRGNR